MKYAVLLTLTFLVFGCSQIQAQEPGERELTTMPPSLDLDLIAGEIDERVADEQDITPIGNTCLTYANLVNYSAWAMVDDTYAQILTSEVIADVLNYMLTQAESDPVMQRAIKAIWAVRRATYSRGGHEHPQYQAGGFGGDHDHGASRFQRSLIGARQVDRLCYHYGHEVPQASPDVLVERLCTSQMATRNESLNPALGPFYGTCR